MTAELNKKPVGRPPKRENQRERILEEAAKLIATVGYDRCSLGEVAKRLGLTRPAVYHYFANKQQVFNEIALRLVQGIFEHVSSRVDPAESCATQLETLMIAHAEYFEDNYWIHVAGVLGYGGVSRDQLTQLTEIDDFRARYERLLTGILRRGVKAGEFRKFNIKTTVLAIYSLLNMVRWYRPDGPKRATAYASEYFEILHSGLRADENQ
jgi:AcrR family transcriptional regulator